MFRLLRFFSITSSIAFIIVGIMLGGLFHKLTIDDLIEFEENKNAALSEAIVESLRSRSSPFVAGALQSASDQLQSAAFREFVLAQVKGSSIVKVQLYDLEGLTVFSTDESEIGTHVNEIANSRLRTQMRIISELTHQGQLSAPEGTIEERDLVSSYIPIQFDGPTAVAIIGLHSDVTPQLRQIKETQQNVVIGVLLILSALFVILFVAVRLADQIIHRQYAARQRAEKALRQAHDNLESVVAERTANLQAELTKRQEAEKRLMVAKDEAEFANRAKSEFLATMSHEVRTPMNGVMGMMGLLRNTDLTEQQQGFVRMAQESAEALLTILDDILDYSKLEVGRVQLERVSVSLEQVLGSVVSLLRPRAEDKGLDLSVDLSRRFPQWVEGDPTRLRQIMFNLIGNAIKFTKTGSVWVTATHTALERDELELRLSVSDTGIGVPEEIQARLFQRFSQADSSTARKFGGSGLGLAICKQLVELMSGEIHIESVVGQGSTFWFTIRCRVGAPPQTSEACEAQPVQPPLRILVAEDNPVNQIVVQTFLEAEGHGVDVVVDGLEAVEAVKKEIYDLVLMDVSMPEMDGPTAARIIRGLEGKVANTPIIALTANAMVGHREEGLSAGMNEYVTKPFDPKELLAAIARVATTVPCET